MDAKKFITNKSICTLPWNGFELEPNGEVKNCIISKDTLGDINKTNIKDIMGFGVKGTQYNKKHPLYAFSILPVVKFMKRIQTVFV